MTTAFVLSGGAAAGAAQVGMLLALVEHEANPDFIVGTSVGALNGGWFAGRGDRDAVEDLARLWRGLRRGDVFPTRLTHLLGAGRRPNLVPDAAIRRILREHLRMQRLEDAAIPLHVVAADVLTGQDVLLSKGDAIDAIVASASIPGVFPPVEIEGRYYVDGGVLNNTPISHAVALGADTVWVLSTGHPCAIDEHPRGALGVAAHAFGLIVNQRLAADTERFEPLVDLRVVPPLCPNSASHLDFTQADELIERSHDATANWLSSAHEYTDQAAKLRPHSHD